ncbi:MAG: hypothetical protein DIJKHBIC_01926 [Thermoanaerobaculia bacterium]|nr:hypothetical protein [Thermoanaerobaculia bacterium]
MSTGIEDFLEALRRYQAPDAESLRFQRRIQSLVDCRREQAFDRVSYSPGHITGSAFIVDRDAGTVLLHFHKRLGKWLQMGGHAEGELDPLQTALREGREESGLLDLVLLSPEILDLDIHEIPGRGAEPSHEHFDVRYAFLTGRASEISHRDEESDGIAWFGFEDAVQKMNEPGAARALSRLGCWLTGSARF